MSRCFPFPPPGYEKKARPDDDANILIKEKHKEKKHKKDKKDKEKKEKKEKKDKEKSGEKNGEKKDRKRKHKDKEKEEKKESEGKKIVNSSSHQNGEKLGPVGIQVDQTHQQGRLLPDLEKGVGKWNVPKEIQSIDKISFKEQSIKSSSKELESNHGIFMEGNQKFKDNKDENRMPDDQSRKVVGKHLENGSLGNVRSKEQKNFEGAVCQDEKVSEKRKERKDKNKHKSSDGKGDKHKDRDRERKSKSKDKKEKKEKVKEVSTPVQTKLTENDNNSVDIQSDRGSYLIKASNSNNGSLGKRKEPEMNGFVHGNEIPMNKLPRPLVSSMVKQNGIRNDATTPGIRFAMKSEAAGAKHKLDAKASCSRSVAENGTKLDSRQTSNNHTPEEQKAVNNHHHKAIESLSSSQPSLGIGRKLEPCQTAINLASKDQDVATDYKLNKKVLSLQPIAENGRKLESSQPCTVSSAERKGAVSKPKLDNQEMRINGLGLRKTDASSTRPPVAGQLKETFEAHLKPPHPDAKYLTEILTVPKVEWSDIDDQSWLFASQDNGVKKPKIGSTKLEESKEVWAEALQLESADVTALPYVIPY